MSYPLSLFSPYPKGDNSLAAGRPLLAVPRLRLAGFMQHAMNH